MWKYILLCIFLIIIGAGICLYVVLKEGVTISITEKQIQDGASKVFPLEKTHLSIVKIVYSDPVFEVLDNKQRIRIGLTATPELMINGKKFSGKAIVNGGFRYDPAQGAFFLTGFAVETLEIQTVHGVTGINLEKISEALSLACEKVYEKHPIYTLSDYDLKQKTAKMLVKEIHLRNKTVHISLGL